jgi:nucleotide-binding universal stress UspA family protein
MYANILVTLETTPTDRAIIEHIKQLAVLLKSRVSLLHVATGVPARMLGPDAGGLEVEQDRAYLKQVHAEFVQAGIEADWHLAFGDPTKEIVNWVHAHPCDLVAMSTHGHKMVADLVLGATASKVQHNVSVPVLMLRAKP